MSTKTFINTKDKTTKQIASEVIEKMSLERQAINTAANKGMTVIGPVITSEMMKNNPDDCAQAILDSIKTYQKTEAMTTI